MRSLLEAQKRGDLIDVKKYGFKGSFFGWTREMTNAFAREFFDIVREWFCDECILDWIWNSDRNHVKEPETVLQHRRSGKGYTIFFRGYVKNRIICDRRSSYR